LILLLNSPTCEAGEAAHSAQVENHFWLKYSLENIYVIQVVEIDVIWIVPKYGSTYVSSKQGSQVSRIECDSHAFRSFVTHCISHS